MVKGFWPRTLREALEIRASQSVVPYAGGTDLMVQGRRDAAYLFLGRLPELREITADAETIHIGAAATFAEALKSEFVPPILRAAVSHIAAPAIRNAGTFGGNLGNGAGKADSVPVFLAADAKLRIVSVGGERMVRVQDFYLGYRKLDLGEDELIAEIILPRHGLEHYFYEKVGGRNALAISRVSFAGIFAAEKGRIEKLAAAFGAVYGMPLRFPDLEGMLLGKTVEEAGERKGEFLDAYAKRLSSLLLPDRVSVTYRIAVCTRLLGAFLDKFGIVGAGEDEAG